MSDYVDMTILDEIDAQKGGEAEDPRKIYMKPLPYTEQAARNHVKRCNELLTQPCLLNAMQNVSKEEEELLAIESKAKKEGLSEEEHQKL